MTGRGDRRDRSLNELSPFTHDRLVRRWAEERASRKPPGSHPGENLRSNTGEKAGVVSLSSLSTLVSIATHPKVSSVLTPKSCTSRVPHFEPHEWADLPSIRTDKDFYVGMIPPCVIRALRGLPERAWPMFLLLWRKWTMSDQEWITSPHALCRHFGLNKNSEHRAIDDLIKAGLIHQEPRGRYRARVLALHPILRAALRRPRKLG
jgi:hypothetical protein